MNSECWYMDGTHSTAPSQFPQLFVIRVPLGGTCATAVYAYLPNKEQRTYENMLNAITTVCQVKQDIPDHEPVFPELERVHCDYEIGIHSAIRSVLGIHVEIQGCLYHLTQSTYRKVQEYGLQTDYRTNKEVQIFCGKLDGLAFLPVNEVKEGMAILKAEACAQGPGALRDKLQRLVKYFDVNYVNGPERNIRPSRRGRRSGGSNQRTHNPPLFPPAVWNVYYATLQGRDRTNNQCESWNNCFRHIVGCKNPTLWRGISCLSDDMKDVAENILRNDRGQLPAKRSRGGTVSHQKTLKRLCKQRENGEKTIAGFLNAIGLCIRIAKPTYR